MSSYSSLLERIIAFPPDGFALLYRPEAFSPDHIEVLTGTSSTADRLADIELPKTPVSVPTPHHEAIVLVPHRQIVERGFEAIHDDAPLLAMNVLDQETVAIREALQALPETPIQLVDGHFDISDEDYADTVRSVLSKEIATGEGSNFVIKRSFLAGIANFSVHNALTLFRRLLVREKSTYWTFLIHVGDRTLVGATPERHVSLHDGVATMTPISGTFRYPSGGPVLGELLDFLGDRKETDELFMVVDEELKMMAQICPDGGRVAGPFLRQMSRLAHTEYLITGRSELDPRQILRETLLAPTVIGSPLENACRVVARHEPRGRGYYGGVAALISRDTKRDHTLDSAILIRTADIRTTSDDPVSAPCGGLGPRASLEVGVGATLVRHSDPLAEIAETRTKAAGVLGALEATHELGEHPQVQEALDRRNTNLSRFWLTNAAERISAESVLSDKRALVVDAEDTFSSMLIHQLRAIGLQTELVPHRRSLPVDGHDLIVLGPGPGDPRDVNNSRISCLTTLTSQLLAQRVPFVAVCLSHQLLCKQLGLELVPRDQPNQGVQHEIDLFGSPERVGFYNSYAARSDKPYLWRRGVGTVRMSMEAETGEVHALRGPHFSSAQFHLESVLTRNSERILTDMVTRLLTARRPSPQKVLT